MNARIASAPEPGRADPGSSPVFSDPTRRKVLEDAAVAGGAELCDLNEANGLLWMGYKGPHALAAVLDAHPNIKWVQLPMAGVENYAGTGAFRDGVSFTCAKGSFAGQVAEHALMLAMLGLRNVVAQARSTTWLGNQPVSLEGQRVTILGGGGIAEELLRMLQPFECHTTVLRRSDSAIAGASETRAISDLHEVLPLTDVLVLALALTEQTIGIIGEQELRLLPPGAVVVNVARGKHIDTDALVESLRSGHLRAAGLDVTEPEPLPDEHPLWALDNVMITSHSADSPDYVARKLGERVTENVSRLIAGEPLVGLVDLSNGY